MSDVDNIFLLAAKTSILANELYEFNLNRIPKEDRMSLIRDNKDQDHELAKRLTKQSFNDIVDDIKKK